MSTEPLSHLEAGAMLRPRVYLAAFPTTDNSYDTIRPRQVMFVVSVSVEESIVKLTALCSGRLFWVPMYERDIVHLIERVD